MRIGDLLAETRRILTIPRDNPGLLRARYAALSNLIPLMYFVVVISSWPLAS